MKKTNKILTNVLLGALTLSSLGLANVQAEAVVPTTKASVRIEDGPITPTFPDGAIEFPGKEFSFKDFFTSGDYNTQAEEGSSLKLGVNDQRSLKGITNGWKLTAQLSPFTNTKIGEDETLGEGTFISLQNGSPVINPEFESIIDPEFKSIIEPPIVEEEIKLQSGPYPENIWYANREDSDSGLGAVGVGEWSLTFERKDISLTIPNNELVGGEHEATITWTFSNTFN